MYKTIVNYDKTEVVLKPCRQFENIYSVASESNEPAYSNEDANLPSESPVEKEDSFYGDRQYQFEPPPPI